MIFFSLNFYLLKDRRFLEDLREKVMSRCFDVQKVVWRGESEEQDKGTGD